MLDEGGMEPGAEAPLPSTEPQGPELSQKETAPRQESSVATGSTQLDERAKEALAAGSPVQKAPPETSKDEATPSQSPELPKPEPALGQDGVAPAVQPEPQPESEPSDPAAQNGGDLSGVPIPQLHEAPPAPAEPIVPASTTVASEPMTPYEKAEQLLAQFFSPPPAVEDMPTPRDAQPPPSNEAEVGVQQTAPVVDDPIQEPEAERNAEIPQLDASPSPSSPPSSPQVSSVPQRPLRVEAVHSSALPSVSEEEHTPPRPLPSSFSTPESAPNAHRGGLTFHETKMTHISPTVQMPKTDSTKSKTMPPAHRANGLTPQHTPWKAPVMSYAERMARAATVDGNLKRDDGKLPTTQASYRRAAASAALKLNFRAPLGFADPASTSTTLENILTQRSTFRQSIGTSPPSESEKPLLNPTCLEMYLNNDEFMRTFGMDKAAFYTQKQWRQRELKRKAGLF